MLRYDRKKKDFIHVTRKSMHTTCVSESDLVQQEDTMNLSAKLFFFKGNFIIFKVIH